MYNFHKKYEAAAFNIDNNHKKYFLSSKSVILESFIF